jgi:pimeloyl-ACP methyl ester carboxylesterase
VRFSTSSDSATSDVDFSSYSAVRNFAPGQTEDVVYVDSRTDKIGEVTERFNVSLSKVNNADIITIASTFGQIFNVNPPSGTAYVTTMGKTPTGKEAYIVFQRVDGPGFIEDKETWLIFHGLNGKSNDFADLGRAIEQYDGIRGGGDYQVVLVDWSAARNEGLLNASLMINSVAQTVKNTLTSWGIQNSKINLAGHSLGAYVGFELSKRLGGVNKLVAMNPASTTLGGYDTLGVDFKRYSNWSWAFWHNHTTDYAVASLTADESFIIKTPSYNLPNIGHGSAKPTWTNMLRNKNGSLSQWFGLDDIRPRSAPWSIDGGWEAEIEVNSDFMPTGRYWNA